MKTAPWSRVASAIKHKYGVSWSDAKRLYKLMGERNGRTASLNMVKRAPAELSHWYSKQLKKPAAGDLVAARHQRWRERGESPPATAAPAAGKVKRPTTRAGREQLKEDRQVLQAIQSWEPATPGEAGPKLKPAPPLPPAPKPVPLETRKPRNRFERELARAGAPFAPATGEAGKWLASLWRKPEAQRAVAETLGKAYRQIARNGRVSENTKTRLDKLVRSLLPAGSDRALIQARYFQMLRELYGK